MSHIVSGTIYTKHFRAREVNCGKSATTLHKFRYFAFTRKPSITSPCKSDFVTNCALCNNYTAGKQEPQYNLQNQLPQ